MTVFDGVPSLAGSDLAYETMYDDDELTGTQTMPWFDPKYLAHDTDEVCTVCIAP